MTPTTDLQKLLAEATKGPWRPHWFYDDCGVYYKLSEDTDTSRTEPDARLIAMAPDLAARVLELEAENKRLREALVNIKNLAIKRQNEGGVEFYLKHFEGFARTALKGGEI
jgi:hypothetical protein